MFGSPSCKGTIRPRTEFSVQFSHLVMSDSATPWIAAHQASQSITNSQSLLKLMSIELVMPSNHLILCRLLLLLASTFPSITDLCIRGPKYWNFTLAPVLPMNIQG